MSFPLLSLISCNSVKGRVCCFLNVFHDLRPYHVNSCSKKKTCLDGYSPTFLSSIFLFEQATNKAR